jgi:PPE-repeat protein
MNFFVLPPEVTSAQMYSGPGSGPLLAAAASWTGVEGELASAADSFSSVISGLPWQGAASAAMAAVATQYAQWLNAAATQAGGAAAQANVAAAIFEAACAAITHPMAVAANRLQLVSLVRSNLLGLNGPAIATTEGAYEGMWAQNGAALAGYHAAASWVAEQLSPWQQALQTLQGLAAKPAAAVAAVARAASNDEEIDVTNDIAAIREVGDDNIAGFVAMRDTTAGALNETADILGGGSSAASVAFDSDGLQRAGQVLISAAQFDAETLTRLAIEDVGLVPMVGKLIYDEIRVLLPD